MSVGLPKKKKDSRKLILAYTRDNATNNDMMVKKLEFSEDSFEGKASQVRCVSHTNNIVAKRVLKRFEAREDKSRRLAFALADKFAAERAT